MLANTPAGLDEIIHIFGDLTDTFEAKYIVSFDLPYTLFYGDSPVNHARCHKLLVENFQRAFEAIKTAGLQNLVTHYAGIYAKRSIRGHEGHPSTHSWGIAIDLEPGQYPLGSPKRFDERIVKIFQLAGFFYGGDFKSRKDPMHFQFATHY